MTEKELTRFLGYVYINERGCWEWQGTRLRPNKKAKVGYGMFRRERSRGNAQMAHRVSYEHYVGPIGNLDVMHKCHNPCCVCPLHLHLGTDYDNYLDSKKAGRPWGPPLPFSKEQVEEIRLAPTKGIKQKELAQKFGVHRTTIGLIQTGKSYKQFPSNTENQNVKYSKQNYG